MDANWKIVLFAIVGFRGRLLIGKLFYLRTGVAFRGAGYRMDIDDLISDFYERIRPANTDLEPRNPVRQIGLTGAP